MSNLRRSVSPFGLREPDASPFAPLAAALASVLGAPATDRPKSLSSWTDMVHLPHFLEKIAEATANDSPELAEVCRFLVTHRIELESQNLSGAVFSAMEEIFRRKTDLFLVTHYDKESCGKMGWADEYRDVVLFSRERDILVGHFFAPFTETSPGQFSEFVNRWVESDNPDRILHFLDFCIGSTNPTFEYYLLFTHLALKRIVSKKEHLQSLLTKVQPILKKMNSASWESNLHRTLAI